MRTLCLGSARAFGALITATAKWTAAQGGSSNLSPSCRRETEDGVAKSELREWQVGAMRALARRFRAKTIDGPMTSAFDA
jgi:hypothetical protein